MFLKLSKSPESHNTLSMCRTHRIDRITIIARMPLMDLEASEFF